MSEVSQVVMLPIDNVVPNPANPRKDVGDVTELAESIKAQGIRQNLLVVPMAAGMYMLVIGHRRHAAAKLAGLTEVPCVIADLSEREQHELMLVENIQRSDLTPLEEADGFQGLLDLGEDVGEIAKATGRSRFTVRRRLKIASIPTELRARVSKSVQPSLEQWEVISRYAAYPDLQEKLVEAAGTDDWGYQCSHAERIVEQVKWRAGVSRILTELNITSVRFGEWGAPPVEAVGMKVAESFYCGSDSPEEIKTALAKYGDSSVLLVAFNPDDGTQVRAWIPLDDSEERERTEREEERERKHEESLAKAKPVREFAALSQGLRFAFLRRVYDMKTTPAHAGEAVSTLLPVVLDSVRWVNAEDCLTRGLKKIGLHETVLESETTHLMKVWDAPLAALLIGSFVLEESLDWERWKNKDYMDTWKAYYHALTIIGYQPSTQEQKALAGGFIEKGEEK
jgi:ParB family chromosome partitioning protein